MSVFIKRGMNNLQASFQKKMLMVNSALVKKKRKMDDSVKAIDGPDNKCLHISSESLHYKYFEQNV